MPRIPRSEQTVIADARPLPESRGDGYEAPGRALQRVGAQMNQLGAEFTAEQRRTDEFDVNMTATHFLNDVQRRSDEFRANYTGDPNAFTSTFMSEHFNPLAQQYSANISSSVDAQRRWQLLLERARGSHEHNANVFQRGYAQHHLTTRLDATINTTIGGMPNADEASVQSVIDTINRQIDSAPGLDPIVRQRLRTQAATLLIGRVRAIGVATDPNFPHTSQFLGVQALVGRWASSGGAGQGQSVLDMEQPANVHTYQPGDAARGTGSGSGTGTGTTDRPDFSGSARGPASIRFNNPGAQYPGSIATRWGSTGTRTIGGGHQIAVFPDALSGAAAQFDLLNSRYTGLTLESAIRRWSGGNSSAAYTALVVEATGLSPGTVLTREMLADPAIAVPLARAMARQEAGRDYPLNEAQWAAAHAMFRAGPGQAVTGGGATGGTASSGGLVNPTIQTELIQLMLTQLPGLRQHAATELRRRIDQYGPMAAQGLLPPEADVANLRRQLEAFGDPDLTAHFQQTLGFATLAQQFRRATPHELEQLILSARAEEQRSGTTPALTRRITELTRIRDNILTQVNQDALTHANNAGVIQLSTLNYADPVSWGVRLQHAQAVAAHYRRPVQYFTATDRAHLQAQIREGGPRMATPFATILQALGPEHAMAAIREFAADQPDALRLAGLVVRGGDPQAVALALEGIQLRATPGFRAIPTPATAAAIVEQTVGDAFRSAPQDLQMARHLADTIFQVLATRAGLTERNNSSAEAVWRQAFEMAIGQRTANGVRFGGVHYQSPGFFSSTNGIILPPTIRADRFRQALQGLTVQDFLDAGLGVPLGTNGRPLSIERLRNGTLVPVGDGRFAIALGNPNVWGREEWVRAHTRETANLEQPGDITAPRDRFVIDLYALAPELHRHVPDLWATPPTPRPPRPPPTGQATADPPGDDIDASIQGVDPRRPPIGRSNPGRRMNLGGPVDPHRSNLGHPPGGETTIPRETMRGSQDDEGPETAPNQDFIRIDDPSAVIPDTTLQQLRDLPPDVIESMGYRRRGGRWGPTIIPADPPEVGPSP